VDRGLFLVDVVTDRREKQSGWLRETIEDGLKRPLTDQYLESRVSQPAVFARLRGVVNKILSERRKSYFPAWVFWLLSYLSRLFDLK
jgi:hypothetical protein